MPSQPAPRMVASTDDRRLCDEEGSAHARCHLSRPAATNRGGTVMTTPVSRSSKGPVTVRQATIELLRTHGLTTWFGNPGSSELTLLEDFPSDFRYVLGLQEMVPVGMADAYAQVTARPALVIVHTAPGLGN